MATQSWQTPATNDSKVGRVMKSAVVGSFDPWLVISRSSVVTAAGRETVLFTQGWEQRQEGTRARTVFPLFC